MPLPRRIRLWPCLACALAAAVALLAVARPALADLEAAMRALQAQDYETAYREAQPLTEQGDVYAERIAMLAKLMIELKRRNDEHRAATGPIDLRDYDGRNKTRSEQDQARFDRGWRHHESEEYETAFSEWLPLAEAGDAEALYLVSWLYRLGRGVAEDPKKADSYRLRAAERGHGGAQAELPHIFDLIMPVDGTEPREGFYWAMRAAANGQAAGYIALSNAYCYGRGTNKNPVLADIWLYMVYQDKEYFLDRICSGGVEFPTSYYEAIAERAEAMLKAYDIPKAALAGGSADTNSADKVE